MWLCENIVIIAINEILDMYEKKTLSYRITKVQLDVFEIIEKFNVYVSL